MKISNASSVEIVQTMQKQRVAKGVYNSLQMKNLWITAKKNPKYIEHLESFNIYTLG